MPSAVCDSFALDITSSLLEAIQRHNFAASKVLGLHLSVFHTSDNTSISGGHCHNISHNDDSYEPTGDNFDEIIIEKRESYIICLEELIHRYRRHHYHRHKKVLGLLCSHTYHKSKVA
ncbi:hypothetical protein TIFTF001_014378 [Ficus carica]|uniref:Uncharacterized protein n=1 Tax=Ficus carica TaxID=3494 RepID=A0AA88D6X3_FICCA|nr:hypothetical protein TIFTF001_014378 [Ficus carica]